MSSALVGFPAAGPRSIWSALSGRCGKILLAIGENPDRDGLFDTPARVARAYRALFAGLRQDPAAPLGMVFEGAPEGDVIVRGIEFFSVCEHHLLPFFGQAHVAYRPAGGRVVGLSKLARTVEVFARRPQVQERLTGQVAVALTGAALWAYAAVGRGRRPT